ncbi:MAG: PIN domain protein [Candidatus Schekmanbacteria bacterium]|nr:PIN domain protein [Candidatus Schekmanbacteria bacterium]
MSGSGRAIRVYVDTSVIGGCLDDEFRTPSIRLFDRSRAGDAVLVISDTTLAELASAPPEVRKVIENLPRECMELVHQDAESEALAEQYIKQAVVSRRMLADAQHIAVATVARVDVLVSWNFRHIVNLDRIHGFNAVNLRAGYPMLEIRSPLEIWKDDGEDVRRSEADA